MNAIDKLIARVEVLSLTLAKCEATNERLYDKLDDQTHELFEIRHELSEAPSKWDLSDLRDDRDYLRESNTRLETDRDYYRAESGRANDRIRVLEAELRQLKFGEFACKSNFEVAKAIIERDPAPDGSKKISHIKQAREALSLGLKEAKDLIEDTYVKLGTHVRDYQGFIIVKPQTLGDLIKEKLGDKCA